MGLTLAPNPLYRASQQLNFRKVATLIGENGSGKSCILYSVFDVKLENKDFTDLRIVSFSSGQNENFSQRFSNYLRKERKAGRSLNLSCFHFDRSWSKLLIFLATSLHPNGRVRDFLRNHDYVEEQAITETKSDDVSSRLVMKFKVDKRYAERVQEALAEETKGEVDTLRSTPYFRSLTSFIESNVDKEYDFEQGLRKQLVELSSKTLFDASYEAERPEDGEQEQGERRRIQDDPTISFFTQAADNDYFIDRNDLKLMLRGNLELDQLSDGEYQTLFLYAMIDLFDEENTLFLFDEPDSHLHYQNIDRLWRILAELKGRVITTTHQLDSITANDFDAIKVVENGCIRDDDKLKQLINRLGILSRATSVEYEVCAKVTNMALLDDYNDWNIFLRLAARKGLDTSRIDSVYAFKKTSSYANETETFGKAKIQWTENLSKVECAMSTTQIFLICDRDEAALNIDPQSGVRVSGQQYRDQIRAIHWPQGANVSVHLLAWKRREIKNYLLSHTALTHHGKLVQINNDDLAPAHHLAANDPGDNDSIRRLAVKNTIDPLINGPDGLSSQKLQDYIDLIPPNEVSEDIENMYNFIVEKLN